MQGQEMLILKYFVVQISEAYGKIPFVRELGKRKRGWHLDATVGTSIWHSKLSIEWFAYWASM